MILFSSVFSKSFHYSTYFSSIISISFHYSACLSFILSISFHYSTWQWYILYYYYSKKKAREPVAHAHVITSGHGRFRSVPLLVAPPDALPEIWLCPYWYTTNVTNVTSCLSLEIKIRLNLTILSMVTVYIHSDSFPIKSAFLPPFRIRKRFHSDFWFIFTTDTFCQFIF